MTSGPTLGLALSSEENPPAKLVETSVDAERAGFTFAIISDHYHPWLPCQGQSPFVWTVLVFLTPLIASAQVPRRK